MRRRIEAVAYLAYQLFTLLFEKVLMIFTQPRRGKALFLHQYKEDQYEALTLAQREALFSSNGCIQCGLCESVKMEFERGLPQELVMGPMRHLPSLEQCPAQFERFRQQLEQIATLCPAQLPLEEIERELLGKRD